MPRSHTNRKPKPKQRNNLFPLWLSLAGLVLLFAAAWAVINSNKQSNANIEATGGPRLKVEKNLIDHGNVRLGTPVRDDIRVTNVGDQPLVFSEAPYIEVREGC